MEDLLKEEEFITKLPDPWKRFRIFYAVNLVYMVCFFIFYKFIVDSEPSIISAIFTFIIIPFGCSLMMIFGRKENVHLPFKTITFAIFLLIAVNVGVIAVAAAIFNGRRFFNWETVEILIAITLAHLLLFAIICSSILLIVNKKKKRVKQII